MRAATGAPLTIRSVAQPRPVRVLPEETALPAVLRGIRVAARLVAPTLGPSGRAVLLGRRGGAPVLGLDAQTVLRDVALDGDPPAEIGLRLARETAHRVRDEVGGGAATAIVLLEALALGTARARAAGLCPVALRRALLAGGKRVLAALESEARPLSDSLGPRAVAEAAACDLEIAETVGAAFERLGAAGMVVVEAGRGPHCRLELHPGFWFEGGIASPHLLEHPEAQREELEAPYLVVYAGVIEEVDAIARILEGFARAGKALLFVAEGFGERALATLVVNRRRAGLKLGAVTAPGAGRWRRGLLEDLAAATGGQVIGVETGTALSHLRPVMLGQCGRAVISRGGTEIIEAKGEPEALARHCAELEQELEEARFLSYDREQLQRRLARLRAGIGVLEIGSVSPSALESRKRLARDAVSAVRAALAEGVVPGGGAALLRASAAARHVSGQAGEPAAAASILAAALIAPAMRIAANAGLDDRAAVALIEAGPADAAFDVIRRRPVEAFAAGLVDPLPVVVTALRAALSTAESLTAIGAVIASAERR